MRNFVVFLRGVNVGGKNILPMKALAAELDKQGFQQVKTYIQSGNIVLASGSKAQEVAETCRELIEENYGLKVPVVVRTKSDYADFVAHCSTVHQPGTDPAHWHFAFLGNEPNEQSLDCLNQWKQEDEQLWKYKNHLIFYLPRGISKTKISIERIERCTGAVATVRNWNTTLKMATLLGL